MTSCPQCGAPAPEGTLKCRSCRAWLVALTPPGGAPAAPSPGPIPAAMPAPAASPIGATTSTADPPPPMPFRVADPAPAPATADRWASSASEHLLPTTGRGGSHTPRRVQGSRLSPRIVAAGCAVVVVGAALWIFFGRGGSSSHSSSTAAKHSVATTTKRKSESPIRRRAEDRAAQSELRNAFTVEKVVYTDNGAYSASIRDLKAVDGSVAFGTRVRVTVGDVAGRGDHNVLCLSETTPGGDVFSIADVALGHQVGTYYGPKRCPSPLTAQSASRLGGNFGA